VSIPIYQNEKRVKLPERSHWCGYCGEQLNGATVFDVDERLVPKDGDYGVCAYCGACGTFQGDQVVPLTVRQMAEMDDENRKALEQAGSALGFSKLKLRNEPTDPVA
jgi:hypothetical protein